MSEELLQKRSSLSFAAITKPSQSTTVHSLKPSISQPTTTRTILLTAKSTTFAAQHKQVAGPLQECLQQKDNEHIQHDNVISESTSSAHPAECAELFYPFLNETHRRIRYAIACTGKVGFQEKMLRNLSFYTDGCREAFNDAKSSSLKCRILARSMTRTMELIHSVSSIFSDDFSAFSDKYYNNMSELVAIYISCKLNVAKDFKEQKLILCNRISNTIHRHLICSSEEVTKVNLLRMFVFIPKMFEEQMIMTTIIKKFLPKPPYSATQIEMPDKQYIQYLIVFHQWKLLENDLEQQIRVLNYANSLMRPSSDMRFNIHYNCYLPQYDALRTATKYILENLNHFSELRYASIKDNAPKNNEEMVILDIEDADDKTVEDIESFADIVKNCEITPFRKPVKSEYQIVSATVDLTIDDDVSLNSDDWLRKLQQNALNLQTKPVNIRLVEVIELDSDSEDETNLTNVHEPELFSLDFVDFMNSEENRTDNIFCDNIFDENLMLEHISEDPTQNLNQKHRALDSSVRTYAITKEKGSSIKSQSTQNSKNAYNTEFFTKENNSNLKLNQTTSDLTLLHKHSQNSLNELTLAVPNSSKTSFSIPRIVDSFSYRYDNLHLLPTTLDADVVEKQNRQCVEGYSETAAIKSAAKVESITENVSKIKSSQSSQQFLANNSDAMKSNAIYGTNLIEDKTVRNNKQVKKVKFNEIPIGPTRSNKTANKKPPKPVISKSFLNKHYKTMWQRFECPSPASSTSSSSTIKGQKERIEELPTLFSSYNISSYSSINVPKNNTNTINLNTNSTPSYILNNSQSSKKLSVIENDPKLKQKCVVVIKRDSSTANYSESGNQLENGSIKTTKKTSYDILDKLMEGEQQSKEQQRLVIEKVKEKNLKSKHLNSAKTKNTMHKKERKNKDKNLPKAFNKNTPQSSKNKEKSKKLITPILKLESNGTILPTAQTDSFKSIAKKPQKDIMKKVKLKKKSSKTLNETGSCNLNLNVVNETVASESKLITLNGNAQVNTSQVESKLNLNNENVESVTKSSVLNKTESLICKIQKTSNIEKFLLNRFGINKLLVGALKTDTIQSSSTTTEDKESRNNIQKLGAYKVVDNMPICDGTSMENSIISINELPIAAVSPLSTIQEISSPELTQNSSLEFSTGISTEISTAASSLALLANMAATTAPISQNSETIKSDSSVAVQTEENLVPLSITITEPILALTSAKEIICEDVEHLPSIVYPVQFSESADSRNKEELLNIETTPTVPPYLFNGESRDVPTPTFPALSESTEKSQLTSQTATDTNTTILTSDHEVSSTQETVSDTSHRNLCGISAKQTDLLLDNAAMLVQNNQVDTTHHLPELNHNLRKRISKSSENDEVTITELNHDVNENRCNNFNTENIINDITPKLTYNSTNGGTSPSTTTLNDELPHKKKRRRQQKNIKVQQSYTKKSCTAIDHNESEINGHHEPCDLCTLEKDVTTIHIAEKLETFNDLSPESIKIDKQRYYINKEGVRIKIITNKKNGSKEIGKRRKK